MNDKGMEKLRLRFSGFNLPVMPIPYSITVSPLGKMTVNVCVWTRKSGKRHEVNRTLGQGTNDANFLMHINGMLCQLIYECEKTVAAIDCKKV